jgi:hypothetical protein
MGTQSSILNHDFRPPFIFTNTRSREKKGAGTTTPLRPSESLTRVPGTIVIATSEEHREIESNLQHNLTDDAAPRNEAMSSMVIFLPVRKIWATAPHIYIAKAGKEV